MSLLCFLMSGTLVRVKSDSQWEDPPAHGFLASPGAVHSALAVSVSTVLPIQPSSTVTQGHQVDRAHLQKSPLISLFVVKAAQSPWSSEKDTEPPTLATSITGVIFESLWWFE